MKIGNLMNLVIFAGFAAQAHAGVGSTGGGMAVVCSDPFGGPDKAELLDVYEARLDSTKTVMRATGSLEGDYYRLIRNIHRLQGYSSPMTSPKEARKSLKKFLSIVEWVGEEEELPFLGDQGKTPEIPENCTLKQLAIFFDDQNLVKIKESIWKLLDSLNKAALPHHELFYESERDNAETNSESSRSYVRQAVTQNGYTPVTQGSESAQTECAAKGNGVTSFFVRSEPNAQGTEDLTLQFTQVGGRPLLVKTTMKVEDIVFATKLKVINQGNDMVLFPADGTPNLRKRVVREALKTEHRSDWELLFYFVPGEPISLTLIQDDVPISRGILDFCTQR